MSIDPRRLEEIEARLSLIDDMPVLRDENLLYTLQYAGSRKGESQYKNRVAIIVQAAPEVSAAEYEATIETLRNSFSDVPLLLSALRESQARVQQATAALQLARRRFSEQNGEVSEQVWRDNYPAVKAINEALRGQIVPATWTPERPVVDGWTQPSDRVPDEEVPVQAIYYSEDDAQRRMLVSTMVRYYIADEDPELAGWRWSHAVHCPRWLDEKYDSYDFEDDDDYIVVLWRPLPTTAEITALLAAPTTGAAGGGEA